jgi:hypothetical protein
MISFSATTDQIRRRTKTVTRRDGWDNLRPGDRLWAVEKAMGLKRGEKVLRLAVIEVVSVGREPLEAITQEDVVREGFPDWTPAQFIALYEKINPRPKGHPNRIEFRYVGEAGPDPEPDRQGTLWDR